MVSSIGDDHLRIKLFLSQLSDPASRDTLLQLESTHDRLIGEGMVLLPLGEWRKVE